MFFPVESRRAWLESLFDKCKPGGAIIVIDKEQADGGTLSTAIHRYVMATKIRKGTSPADVLRKETALCGIQNPLPRDFFRALPAREFFRFGDFAGWIIEKPET